VVTTEAILQQAACATTSSTNLTVPAGPWTSLPHGAFTLNPSVEVGQAAVRSGGGRLAVQVAVWTRAVDDAGEGGLVGGVTVVVGVVVHGDHHKW
jgi:hypothetical protein